MTVDQKVSSRLAELIELGQRVLATRSSLGPNVIGDDRVDIHLAAQWSTSVKSLLSNAFGEGSEHYKEFVRYLEKYPTFSPTSQALGVLKAAQDDFNNGHLVPVRQLIEAEVFDGFLEQSAHLLSSGYHQAAAVLAGCVLEDGLRTLCHRNGVPLSGRQKLDQMNAELAKIGVYNKLVQKRITTLADVRNKAAHGLWDQFGRQDVEEMLPAVRRFMEEFLT